jgi:DNA invertase Pin-like site-specific DNA recombinase
MISLEQKKQIKHLSELGKNAPSIAKALNIKVRTVRKWTSRIKKGAHCIQQWGVQNLAQ